MVKKLFAEIGAVALVSLLILPVFTFAQGGGNPSPSDGGGNTGFTGGDVSKDIQPPPNSTGPITSVAGKTNSVLSLVQTTLLWVSIAFWIAAAGFIFYAAYLYLVAGGDAERVKKAHKQLLWAVVAIVVAIMAQAIPTLVGSFLKGQ